jgi:hypothetical protein
MRPAGGDLPIYLYPQHQTRLCAAEVPDSFNVQHRNFDVSIPDFIRYWMFEPILTRPLLRKEPRSTTVSSEGVSFRMQETLFVDLFLL